MESKTQIYKEIAKAKGWSMVEVSLSEEPISFTHIIKKLIGAGFDVFADGEQDGETVYTVGSLATGATIKTGVKIKELKSYITCMEYVQATHGDDMNISYKYIKPVHDLYRTKE